ncbi:hypothetical protein BaRGS_00030497 [Batillaria attramentaria]|uniref:Uncharacterized protein n=1 Tax=Batillaria attramentaria TaxID=370345 RepID=A0ABD0JU90_9CAEN
MTDIIPSTAVSSRENAETTHELGNPPPLTGDSRKEHSATTNELGASLNWKGQTFSVPNNPLDLIKAQQGSAWMTGTRQTLTNGIRW